ncbi:uncharacterized protein EV420DRAFT_1653887 [Desarmillaria tabescens]|uniref:Uncharacterized protein n=1 Tax=Armillaria tabescens TaxID=1929756 RepID=A0AA39J1Z8_ARMTA|nr:uncharacterized protein EV420DRAFT_1653887 [Desarmillaria tabescens]KAK0434661.1 hypothetical protein EV420DRAFT_1653887 [Desarmillaria tabescens]
MPELKTPLPTFGPSDKDAEHEPELGDTLTPNVEPQVNLMSEPLQDPLAATTPAGFSGLKFKRWDEGSLTPMSSDEEDEQALHGEEHSTSASQHQIKARSFVVTLSESECQEHFAKLKEDKALAKQWHLRLLGSSLPWMDTNNVTESMKRKVESSPSGPTPKAPRLNPVCYECADEPLLFPNYYVALVDQTINLSVLGLKSTFQDDKETVLGWQACACGSLTCWHGKSINNWECMVAHVSTSQLAAGGVSLQALLRTKQVFVTSMEGSSLWEWDIDSMKKIGNVDVPQEVQDHSTRSKKDMELHIECSLCSVLEQRDQGSKGLVLNALYLPRAERSLVETPHAEPVMSQSIAFDQTREVPTDIFDNHYPKDATCFTLASTMATFSYIHHDGIGVGTVIQVLTGKKIWFFFHRVACHIQDTHVDEFMDDWVPGFIPDPTEWEAEVVVLEPGTVLQVICGPTGQQGSDVHIPDISTQLGLLDVVALGNFCIFALALNGEHKKPTKDGMHLAITSYKDIIRFATCHFILYGPDGILKMPYGLARQSALHFG